MNTEIKDISETRKELVITIEQSEVNSEHEAVVAEFVKVARIPGFRPGKAPASMVTRQFAKQIDTEFKQKLVGKAYRSALESSKLDPLTIIKVDDGNPAAGKSAVITVTVDIAPDFKLPEYIGIPTIVEAVEVTDKEIDAAIDQIRAERADFKVVERASKKNDYMKLSYEGFIDDKPISEILPGKQIYGKIPQTWEEVDGENEGLLPSLGKKIKGLSAGDKKTVEIKFPAEYPQAPELAGKKASYNIEVLEVRERVLPEINEDFLKSQQVKDLDELKKRVSENLKSRKEYSNRQEQRIQVTEALNGMVDFFLPESVVEAETQNILRNFMEENVRRGAKPEDFEKNKESLVANARKAAEARTKTRFILAKIAEKEKVKVEEKDINRVIYQEAMLTRSTPDKLARELSKDRERLRSIQQSIILDKTIELLVSKAKVEVKKK